MLGGMTIPAHISLITLGVEDLPAMTGFYQSLGWELSSASTDGVSFFRTGAVALGLYSAHALAADAGREAPVAGFRGFSLAINLPAEADVDAALVAAEAAGGTMTRAAARADWGGYSGYFADPEGNAWEVAFNPGFPLRADGSVELPR